MVRRMFPAPEIHVVAAEYGAAAHEQGWLRLDRTLRRRHYSRLVDTAKAWAKTDRTLHDVLATYGRPSVTFGDTDPRSPKTFGYACGDRSLPLVVFHFGESDDTQAARLLGFRRRDSFFDGVGLTPFGWHVVKEGKTRRSD
jgi:hypothetical protein